MMVEVLYVVALAMPILPVLVGLVMVVLTCGCCR